MNVALYARVSTDTCEVSGCGKKPALHPNIGHDFRGQDPEVQLLELRAWCAAQKHTIIEEYVDRGISGTKASRPQLDRLMADATKGLRDIQVVAVLRLDRFGRSVQHLHVAVGKLLAAKVEFISVKDGFDLTTPMGKLLFGILATFAEFERNVIAERTKDGLKKARVEGHIPGRKIDPAKGPSKTTAWRQRIGARALAAVMACALLVVRYGKLLG
jgi:DNA invertase Pin-like site-specific DNA recombinase